MFSDKMFLGRSCLQAQFLEQILTEANAHPSVKGGLLFGQHGSQVVATRCARQTTISRILPPATLWTRQSKLGVVAKWLELHMTVEFMKQNLHMEITK